MKNLDKQEFIKFLDRISTGEWFYKDGRVYRTKKRFNQFKTVDLDTPEVVSKVTRNGYRRVTVDTTVCLEHRLVFAIHHGMDSLYSFEAIDHIDGDKQNNRIENLRGVSIRENTLYAEQAGNFKRTYGDINGMCKLSATSVTEIRDLVNGGENQYVVAKRFGVSQGYISALVNDKARKYG